MQTPKIIEKFNFNGLSSELYSDGDFVITLPNGQFLQMSADAIAMLFDKSKDARFKSVRTTPVKLAPIDKGLCAPKKSTQDDALIRRRIDRVDSGWECTFKVKDKDDVKHVYAKRDCARHATPNTEIGINFRVA